MLPLNLTHVNVTVTVCNAGARGEAVSLAFDGASHVSAWVHVPAAGGGGGGSGGSTATATAAAVAVPGAKPWHPSSPHLHTVRATVGSSGDAAVARFGLRTLSVTAAGRFALNGKVLTLKGVNRHTMSAASGAALTLAEVKADVKLLKRLGVNYVRGAHYPQDQRFVDLLDEAGILLWEEALGPQVTSADIASPAFMAAQVLQVREMVRASYSHPSIVFHGFFNEGPADDPAACAGYSALAREIRSLVPPSHRLVTWASSAKTHDRCFEAADVLSFNECNGPVPWPHHPSPSATRRLPFPPD